MSKVSYLQIQLVHRVGIALEQAGAILRLRDLRHHARAVLRLACQPKKYWDSSNIVHVIELINESSNYGCAMMRKKCVHEKLIRMRGNSKRKQRRRFGSGSVESCDAKSLFPAFQSLTLAMLRLLTT